MDCARIKLRGLVARLLLAASAALLSTSVQAQRTTPAGPAATKAGATEAVIENGKVVFRTASRPRARGSKDGEDEEAAQATDEPREWLVEVKSGTDRPYLPPPLSSNPLMCRPAGFGGGI